MNKTLRNKPLILFFILFAAALLVASLKTIYSNQHLKLIAARESAIFYFGEKTEDFGGPCFESVKCRLVYDAELRKNSALKLNDLVIETLDTRARFPESTHYVSLSLREDSMNLRSPLNSILKRFEVPLEAVLELDCDDWIQALREVFQHNGCKETFQKQ